MHAQGNLEPVSYIGGGIVALLGVVVGEYMWRAKQSDMYELELKKQKDIKRLKLPDYTVPQVDDNNI